MLARPPFWWPGVQTGFSLSGQGDIILKEDIKTQGSSKWDFPNDDFLYSFTVER